MTAPDDTRGAGEEVVALANLVELMELGVVDEAAVDAVRRRLLRGGGELLLDDWRARVETVTLALREAAGSAVRRRDLLSRYVMEVEAGVAALAVVPMLVEMYPEMASELPEAVAGFVRCGVVSHAGGLALLDRTAGIDEAEARFCHAVQKQRGVGAAGVADA